jgi:hypothetical protein
MSGGSYYSQNAMTLYFGLGSGKKIDSIEVHWPSGEAQTWRDVIANRTLILTEGKESIQEVRWAQR